MEEKGTTIRPMREQDKEGVTELRRSYGQQLGIGALDALTKYDPDCIYVAVTEDETQIRWRMTQKLCSNHLRSGAGQLRRRGPAPRPSVRDDARGSRRAPEVGARHQALAGGRRAAPRCRQKRVPHLRWIPRGHVLPALRLRVRIAADHSLHSAGTRRHLLADPERGGRAGGGCTGARRLRDGVRHRRLRRHRVWLPQETFHGSCSGRKGQCRSGSATRRSEPVFQSSVVHTPFQYLLIRGANYVGGASISPQPLRIFQESSQ
ncbi:hypothetical protein HPB51_012025 [Rhipicephalus microplus]|uniref:Uncharacterized protein n=1 Tax=Rhipicephalus microplus TaxID=6941 RepID=A0A9J6F1K4_RHIMP|nr:hypothetical protein HPB51_012025 [Rhipicephalus microplus]